MSRLPARLGLSARLLAIVVQAAAGGRETIVYEGVAVVFAEADDVFPAVTSRGLLILPQPACHTALHTRHRKQFSQQILLSQFQSAPNEIS